MNIDVEVLPAIVYAGIFLGIFAFGEWLHRQLPNKPELSRKSVHLLGGLTAVTFPYYLSSHWTVLVLAGSFLVIILLTKRRQLLRSVHGVSRRSHGGVYYPVAIYLVFLLSAGNPVFYVIPILVMTVSDSLAALAGVRYGTIRYEVEEGRKTLEGSLVFFLGTFLCVHLSLLLMTGTGRVESVLLALLIAILVTGFETISLSGSDNIVVPLGVYFIIAKMSAYPVEVTVCQFWMLLVVVGLALLVNLRRKFMKPSGMVGLVLLNYTAWSLCNVMWFVPLAMAQVLYAGLLEFYCRRGPAADIARHQVRILLSRTLIPLLIIFIANTTKQVEPLHELYLAVIASQMAMITLFFVPFIVPHRFCQRRIVRSGVSALIASGFVCFNPLWLWVDVFSPGVLGAVFVAAWAACEVNIQLTGSTSGMGGEVQETRGRMVGGATALAVMIFFQMGGI